MPLWGRWKHLPRNRDWWPNQLNIRFSTSNSNLSDPMGEDFNYAKEFKTLDLDAVIKGPPCPDDRLAGVVAGGLRPLWAILHPHGMARAGTYRVGDGRGGAGPVSNVSRRSTAGRTTAISTRRAGCSGRSSRSTADKISWADLMVLTGNVALGIDGLQDVWFRRRPRRRLGAGRRRLLGRPKDWLGDESATAANAA